MFAAAIASVEAHSGDAERRAVTFAQIGRLQAVSGDSQSAVPTRAWNAARGANTHSITSPVAWRALEIQPAHCGQRCA